MRNRPARPTRLAAVLTLAALAVAGAAGTARAACSQKFTLTPTPATAAPDTTVTLDVSGLHDEFCNLITGVDNVSVVVTRPDLTASSTILVSTVDGAGSASWTDTTQYGSYAAKATSGAATAKTSFVVKPGPGAGTFTAAPDPASQTAGHDVTLSASGIADVNNKPVVNGTTVLFTVTRSDDTETSCSADTTGVAKSTDTAIASCTIEGADNPVAGDYDVDVSADDATAATTYKIVPGPPAADLDVQASDAHGSTANPVTVCGIPDEAASAAIKVSKPDDTTFVPPAATTFVDGCATFTVPSGQTGQLGTYKIAAKSFDDLAVVDGIGDGSFAVSVAALAIDAPSTVNTGTDFQISVSNVPSSATSVALTITKPSNAASTVTATPEAGAATFDIDGVTIDEVGDYSVSVEAKNGAVTVGDGDASFSASTAALTVSAPDVEVWSDVDAQVSSIPGDATAVTLTVTRPDESTFDADCAAPAEGSATCSIDGSNLNQFGTFKLDAEAFNDVVSMGTGHGEMQVTPSHEYDKCNAKEDISSQTELDTGKLTAAQPGSWHPTICIASDEASGVFNQPLFFFSGHPVNASDPTHPCAELWVVGQKVYDNDDKPGNASLC